MSDEKRYTQADLRLAYVAAATRWGAGSLDAERQARKVYPDPEPERPTVEHEGWHYRLSDNGKHIENTSHRDNPPRWVPVYPVGRILALASLLPRVPVTVTEEMVEKAAESAYNARNYGETWASAQVDVKRLWRGDMRAALLAVASDLAQPVHACQHRATRWEVRDRHGFSVPQFPDRKSAENLASIYDHDWPEKAPHRVVNLAEVE
jgi:hypothetical protein